MNPAPPRPPPPPQKKKLVVVKQNLLGSGYPGYPEAPEGLGASLPEPGGGGGLKDIPAPPTFKPALPLFRRLCQGLLELTKTMQTWDTRPEAEHQQ